MRRLTYLSCAVFLNPGLLRSLDHDLHVRLEREHTAARGVLIRCTQELYEIQLGVEPAAGAAGIPEGFQVEG